MKGDKLYESLSETVKAWQDEESNFQEIKVDKGNVDIFIKEIYETVTHSMKPVSNENTRDYRQAYKEVLDRIQVLEDVNSDLTKALINVSLQLNN